MMHDPLLFEDDRDGLITQPFEQATLRIGGGGREFVSSGLVRWVGWFLAEPGCVLENALRAGVVNELLAPDETLLHRKPAPGTEAIREVD